MDVIAVRAQLVRAKGQNISQCPGPDTPSPCIGVCAMDPTSGLCSGCWRTLDEIKRWSSSTDADKRATWGRITQRLPLPVDPSTAAKP